MPFVTQRPTRLIGILLAWLLAASSVLAATTVAATGMASREPVPGQEGAHRVTLHIAIGSTIMTATLNDKGKKSEDSAVD